jgi:hypothetical protein
LREWKVQEARFFLKVEIRSSQEEFLRRLSIRGRTRYLEGRMLRVNPKSCIM